MVFKIELLAPEPSIPLIGRDYIDDMNYRRMYSTKLVLTHLLRDHVFDGTYYEKYRSANLVITIMITPRYKNCESISNLISSIYNGQFDEYYSFKIDTIDLTHSLMLKYGEISIELKEEIGDEIVRRIKEVIYNWPHTVAGYILQYITRRDHKRDIAIVTALYGGDTLTVDKLNLIRAYTIYRYHELKWS